VISAFLLAVAIQTKTFDRCGIHLSYPATWSFHMNRRDAYTWDLKQVRCTIDLGDSDVPAVTIVVTDQPLLAIAKNAGFRPAEEFETLYGQMPAALKPGDWGVDGLGIARANHFHTQCCEVLRGSLVNRDSHSSELAVIGRGRHSAIVSTASDVTFTDALTLIVKSFRFEK